MKTLNFLAIVSATLCNSGFTEETRRELPDGGNDITAEWTAYYIADVKPSKDGDSGATIYFTNLSGKRFRYHMTAKSYRHAEMEAVAAGVDAKGKERFGYRVKEGEWKELPPGAMGMGNRMNPLVPWIHVAADQRKYPYGSMIYVKDADGHKTVDGEVLDGFFWIADVGGMVKGRTRFDLFVGRDKVYSKVTDREWKPTIPAVVYPLPKPPKGLDPMTPEGQTAILNGCGFKIEGEDPEGKKLKAALIQFQKSHKQIPEAEHGIARAATTLWFLTSAAKKVAEDKNK